MERLCRRGAAGALSAALGADALDHAPAAVALEPGVDALDLVEDLVGDLLLLLARRVLDTVEADRVAVLDGHLRELQALPVAHLRRAEDRDRHDRRPGLEREPPDPRPGLFPQ